MSGNHNTPPRRSTWFPAIGAGWTIARIRQDAALIRPVTSALCNLILDERSHPKQGLRVCLSILGLTASYGPERLDAATARAIHIGARIYGSVKSIFTNLDRRPPHHPSSDDAPILHADIRRPHYYN